MRSVRAEATAPSATFSVIICDGQVGVRGGGQIGKPESPRDQATIRAHRKWWLDLGGSGRKTVVKATGQRSGESQTNIRTAIDA